MLRIDDIWLASFLVSQGATVGAISVLPAGNRMTAVFELNEVPDAALVAYSRGSAQADVHLLRAALNRLRDLMHSELEKKNGNHTVKAMPNGGRSDGQRRCERNENRAVRHR
jgi:hypothetical protein